MQLSFMVGFLFIFFMNDDFYEKEISKPHFLIIYIYTCITMKIDLLNVFETFLPQLLHYPNPTDPLNSEAAALLMREPEQFKAKVRDYVKKYATREKMLAAGDSKKDKNKVTRYVLVCIYIHYGNLLYIFYICRVQLMDKYVMMLKHLSSMQS